MKGYAGGEHTLAFDEKSGKLYSAGACGLGWCRDFDLSSSLYRFRFVPKIPEPIQQIYASYYHNLIVTKSGNVYTWGCGTFTDSNAGMDGVIPALGPYAKSDKGEMPQKVSMPNYEPAKAVTGGAYHSAILTSKGTILTFGAGQLGQLGRDVSSSDASGLPVDPTPKQALVPCNDDDRVTTIGSGFYNTFAICKSGDLYCTGENQNKQCGEGPKNLNRFNKVRGIQNVDQVDGGYCHTLVKNLYGDVFSFGCGEDGQRGDGLDGESDDRKIVSQVNLPVKAKKVAAGANHSVILGEDGNVYTFGANDVGQCGVIQQQPTIPIDDNEVDETTTSIISPMLVRLPENAGHKQVITDVSAGYSHTVLTTQDGKLYMFGQNDSGQLGVGADQVSQGNEPRPEILPIQVTVETCD